MLDFSDLEHDAIRLLVNDQGQPTDLARQWGQRYAEIMVDEYQDTNQVQNTIFRALSQDGKNLFLVGDVKQSIYRFRLADPTIFLEKYRTFYPYDQAAEGEERRITLSKNFRSRPEVLEAANDLFRCVMSRELGELDYTADQALYPGGTFPAGEGYETELHVLNFSEDPAYTQQKIERNDLEARFVAKQIADLLQSGFPVSDGQGGTAPWPRMTSPFSAFSRPCAPVLHPGPRGPGGQLVRRRGERPLSDHGGLRRPLLAPDHRQPPPGHPAPWPSCGPLWWASLGTVSLRSAR